MRQVVVTGLGLVTPLGSQVSLVWNRIIQGCSGIVSVKNRVHEPTGMSYDGIPSQVAGFIDSDFPKIYKDEKKLTPFMSFAMEAARQAIQDSGYVPKTPLEQEKTAVCVGTGIGCLEEVINTFNTFKSDGYRKMSPFFVPKILMNLAAGHISLQYGYKGPNLCVSTACATGAHAIADAGRLIQSGEANVAIAGGTESSVSPLSMAGFSKARSLSVNFNNEPEKASRPFDGKRDGFVISQGAGIIVLEELEHAKKRNARIYAHLKGWGVTSDAHHYTAPPDDGNGATRAMHLALKASKQPIEKLAYINAHATSTPQGDMAEARAIRNLLGSNSKVCISSTKGHIGHLLGAAGSVEAIFTILALHNRLVPGTLNLTDSTAFPDLNLIKEPESLKSTHSIALTNSFGFGGTNVSLCFGSS